MAIESDKAKIYFATTTNDIKTHNSKVKLIDSDLFAKNKLSGLYILLLLLRFSGW
jgi:hypothetical protein